MPKISVIVPIYGTERFLERCLRSILAQTLEDIEILCIDDCSPDRSAQVVEALAAQDHRIRLIRHVQNRGLGGARNTGIDAASAPYLASVDSDDYILPQMMERLWEATGGGVADIVVCGMTLENEAGDVTEKIAPKPARLLNDANQIDIFRAFNPSFCNKLWRRVLFTGHGIRFPEHTYYEDLATSPRVLSRAKLIEVIDANVYRYVYRGGSITNSTSARHILDYFKCFELLKKFLMAEGLLKRYRLEFTDAIGRSLHYHSKNVMNSTMSEAEKIQYLRQMLILKLGFLQFDNRMRVLDGATLQDLLRNATGGPHLPAPPGTGTGPA